MTKSIQIYAPMLKSIKIPVAVHKELKVYVAQSEVKDNTITEVAGFAIMRYLSEQGHKFSKTTTSQSKKSKP